MVKTLTIREDVYNKLIALKAPDESFSDLFERLVERQGSLATLRSLRGSLQFRAEEKKSFLHDIQAKRGEERS